jgi:hypothetical protein
MLAAREVIRLSSIATKLLSKLLAIPTEWSAMDYEQYCSTSQALLTGLPVSAWDHVFLGLFRMAMAFSGWRWRLEAIETFLLEVAKRWEAGSRYNRSLAATAESHQEFLADGQLDVAAIETFLLEVAKRWEAGSR